MTEPKTSEVMEGLRTVAEVNAEIPRSWGKVEIAIGTCLGDAVRIRRVSLHRDSAGRRVVLLHDKPLNLRHE